MSFVNTKSVAFVGASSQYVSFGNVLGMERTAARSLSFWVKWTSATGMDLVVTAETTTYRGWGVVTTAAGQVAFYLTNTNSTNQLGVRTNTAFNDGRWHHIVVTYAGTSLPTGVVFYVDGALQAQTTLVNNLSATIVTTAELEFGSRASSVKFPFTGKLDEIAIYNKALTATEAQTISTGVYDLAVVGPTANLIGYWRMGDGDTYPTLLDSSSGAHSGTMTNMSAGSIVTDSPLCIVELVTSQISYASLIGPAATWGDVVVAVPQIVHIGPPSLAGTWNQGTVPSLDVVMVEYNSTYGVRVHVATYKMRGKKADNTFVTWKSKYTPNPVHPAGLVLTDVTISDKWIDISD